MGEWIATAGALLAQYCRADWWNTNPMTMNLAKALELNAEQRHAYYSERHRTETQPHKCTTVINVRANSWTGGICAHYPRSTLMKVGAVEFASSELMTKNQSKNNDRRRDSLPPAPGGWERPRP